MTFKPEVIAYLNGLQADGSLPLRAASQTEHVDRVEEFPIGDAAVPVRAYIPNSPTPLPVLVYFHGGGWVIGDLEMHDHTCRLIANQARCLVLNVAYRLAPQNRFPIPMQDCYDAVVWAHESVAQLGGDPHRIGVAGSSSGGNLAASVALRARDVGHPRLAAQVLIYPVLDATLSSRTYEEHSTAPILTRAAMEGYWNQYLTSEADRTNAYASPTCAESLEGLPPTLIAAAEYDPLRDEATQYAERLRAAAVDVTERVYEGQIHGFLALDSSFEASIDLTQTISDFVSWHLRDAAAA